MAENKKNEIAETGKKQAEIIVNNALIDGLARQIEQKQQYGLSFPNDYNPVNALNGAYLVLQETTDANKRPVLQSCTQTSIAHCLMDMVTMGLSMQKNQCYPVAYGGKLKLMVSYHGHKTMAHRCGAKTIRAEVIYEGDEFEYHIKNGCKVIDKHTQNFENLDLEKIAGAYCIINMNDGSQYVEVMNINQLKTAWSKGYGYKPGKGVHKDFTDMMAKKTVTSRACRQIVQQYGDDFADSFEESNKAEYDDQQYLDAEYNIETNENSEFFDESVREKDFDDVVEAIEEPVGEDTPDWM